MVAWRESTHITYIWEPPTAIWGALTTSERHQDWYLMPCLRMGSRAGSTCAWGEPGREMVTGRVTAFRPSQGELGYTHELSWIDEPAIRASWSLEQQGEITEVKVTHRYAEGASQSEILLASAGIALVLARLKTLVETGDPMPWPSDEAPFLPS